MIGIILMILSIFPIMAGLYFPHADVTSCITVTALVTGLIMLIAGIVFYKILKTDS